MSTFDRMSASFHYNSPKIEFIDKFIDYDGKRSVLVRAKVGKEAFPNLTAAREHVIKFVLGPRGQARAAKLENGNLIVVNNGYTGKRRQKIIRDMSKGIVAQAAVVKKPGITITMTVNEQRVKIDCPTTKEAIAILKGI